MNTGSYKNAMNSIKMPEERINGILAAARNVPTRRKKVHRMSFPLIAAAVIMLAGFTAYAAGNGVLSLIFGFDGDYSPFENMTGEMEIHSLETYIDGLEVTPMGFAADSYTVYSVFRLDFDEPLPEAEKYKELLLDGYSHCNTELVDMLESFSPNGRASGGAMTRFIKEDKDTLYAAYTVSCGFKMSGEITLDYTCYNLAIGNYKGLLSDSFIYDKSLFAASFTVNIPDVEGKALKTDGTVLDGFNAKIYPCSIVIDTDKSSLVEAYSKSGYPFYYDVPVYVTLKNGEEIEILGSSVSYLSSDENVIAHTMDTVTASLPTWLTGDYYLYYRGYLEYPAAPEEIESLNIGGSVIYTEE